MPAPLEGILIVDTTVYQNGPYATVMLSDMGADVIKIEEPGKGDPGRGWRRWPPDDKQSYNNYFEAHNRNKRSLTLDLKQPAARKVVYQLAERADVFVQNWRLGVAERLALDYEHLRMVNPRIIYAHNTGLGPEGPDAQKPVFDIIGQSRGGLMSVNGAPDSPPAWVPAFGLADQVGAIMLGYAISVALLARERFGVGQAVDVSQLGSQIALQAFAIQGTLVTGVNPPRYDRVDYRNPLWNSYQGSDGRWFVLGCFAGDRYWPGICRAIAREDLRHDPRFAGMRVRGEHAVELVAELDAVFATRPAAEWVARLEAEGVVCGPVQDYCAVAEDPQVWANGYLVNQEHPTVGTIPVVNSPVRLSETPGRKPGWAPELGQHTEEILLELGYEWEAIAALRDQGAI